MGQLGVGRVVAGQNKQPVAVRKVWEIATVAPSLWAPKFAHAQGMLDKTLGGQGKFVGLSVGACFQLNCHRIARLIESYYCAGGGRHFGPAAVFSDIRFRNDCGCRKNCMSFAMPYSPLGHFGGANMY